MDVNEIIQEMGFCNAETERFRNAEDGENYDVWKITHESGNYVLKKAKKYEYEIYSRLLKYAEHSVPKFYKAVDCGSDKYILIEYIQGNDLRKCSRKALTAVLDALIYLQDLYWENAELCEIGLDYCTSLHGREDRGRYLNDAETERAYAVYLELYSTLPRTLCHDDLLPFNALVSEEKAVIIDWEVGGILPYLSSLARLLAHANDEVDAFFYMKDEDKQFALEYYYAHLVKEKGISYIDYRRALDYFMLYEYCEWVMLGNKYGDTDSQRFREYYAKAKELAWNLNRKYDE